MLISIILPTRQRVAQLSNFLSSIYSTVYDLNNVEVLVAVDQDDTDTITFLKNYNLVDIRMFTFEERYHYKGLYKYSNYLAQRAQGSFISFGCDDNQHLSPYWDLILKEYLHKFVIINPLTPSHQHYCRGDFNGLLYPIIPRLWVDIIGGIGNNTALDSWVQEVAQGAMVPIINEDKIVIESYRYEETGRNKDDIIHRESMALAPLVRNDYHSAEKNIEREQDIIKILNYFEKNPQNS